MGRAPANETFMYSNSLFLRMRDLTRVFCVITRLSAIALIAGLGIQAQQLQPSAERQMAALLAEKSSRTPAQRKMDSHLVHATQILRGQPVHPDFRIPPGEIEAVRLDSHNHVVVD